MSPFNAWLHLKSLETLGLRMRAHCENAQKIADFLAEQKKVLRVLYPFRADHPQHNLARAQMDGGGGVVTFEVEGGKEGAYRVENALKLIRHIQQSGRHEKPDDPPRDHHASAAFAGSTCGPRRDRRHAAHLGGPRRPPDICEDLSRR